MTYHFDGPKNTANITKHGVSFEQIAEFRWDTAITMPDMRWDYGEERCVSYGFVGERLHILVWTMRNGEQRPISFRKANKRERIFYEKKSTES